jgi:hypothetical protein
MSEPRTQRSGVCGRTTAYFAALRARLGCVRGSERQRDPARLF